MIYLDRIIRQALEEDIRQGDITSNLLIDDDARRSANIIAKEGFVVAGSVVVKRVFEILDYNLGVTQHIPDGGNAKPGAAIFTIEGRLRSILAGERVALNFLQHLSAIATVTGRFVKIASEYGVQIVDTRKTIPNLRFLEKEAVVAGGGYNHRMGLYDRILIKDNHIKYCGSVTKAVTTAIEHNSSSVLVEVETKDLGEVKEAVEAGADIIMFDNMTPEMINDAIKIVDGKAKTEVSGGVTLENLPRYASTRPDYISVGALTHSAVAVDITLLIE